MAPIRRRTTALLVAAGLLVVAVVGLAWFLVGEDEPSGSAAAGDTAGGGDTAGADTSGPPAPPAPPCAGVLSGAEAAAEPSARLENAARQIAARL